jgi:hypothetical protein
MNPVLAVHVLGGSIALAAGLAAAVATKGGRVHTAAGIAFVLAMVALGLTAAVLGPQSTPPDSPVGGLVVVYFVATGWATARRREARPGIFDVFAFLFIAFVAVATAWVAIGQLRAGIVPDEPPPPAVLLVFAGLCALAALGDLRWLLRRTLTPVQRRHRHLWRMGWAWFMATGAFFLGQQGVMPEAWRGWPGWFVLAFAPLGLVAWGMVRIRTRGWATK